MSLESLKIILIDYPFFSLWKLGRMNQAGVFSGLKMYTLICLVLFLELKLYVLRQFVVVFFKVPICSKLVL